MIPPAGLAIDALASDLARHGFVPMASADYRAAFVRSGLALVFTCGRYGEELRCAAHDANGVEFDVFSFLDATAPLLAQETRAVALANDASKLDFDARHHPQIAGRYLATMRSLIAHFLKAWPDGSNTIDAGTLEGMRRKDQDILASLGLSPEQTWL